MAEQLAASWVSSWRRMAYERNTTSPLHSIPIRLVVCSIRIKWSRGPGQRVRLVSLNILKGVVSFKPRAPRASREVTTLMSTAGANSTGEGNGRPVVWRIELTQGHHCEMSGVCSRRLAPIRHWSNSKQEQADSVARGIKQLRLQLGWRVGQTLTFCDSVLRRHDVVVVLYRDRCSRHACTVR